PLRSISFPCRPPPRALHSFPTRRSSDLLNVDHYTAFVAVTHDPKIDDPALLHAFERDCFYIGALGSRKTHAKRAERLKAQGADRSEEHTSELQSLRHLVCRLLLEKKKKK